MNCEPPGDAAQRNGVGFGVAGDLPAGIGAASYLEWLRAQPGYRDQVSFHCFFPERTDGEQPGYHGRFCPMLERLQLTPYRHQVEAFAALEAGLNVVVATPTASGKSLCYQLPALDALAGGSTALFLYPTKALAHDQLGKLQQMSRDLGLNATLACYDGDTPGEERRPIRERAGCLITNPDMLHYGILPHHGRWSRFLAKLALVVVDELHSYRGVMGTHVANILRRLLRLTHHYGAAPQVVAASATIGNPAEHAERLNGLPFVAVTQDGGPRSARELVFWRPPDLPGGLGRRRSATGEAADLAALFARAGLKSIFFANARKVVELLRRYATGQLSAAEALKLQSYRAGYTAEDRRQIEAAFKRGDITVLTATSALELGVDVGGVDAVVLVGYPGSMTALWQRAGRAGRRGRRALTLLIPAEDPLDEYYLAHPELIVEGRAETAVADPFNSELHPLHLACAAYENPVAEEETAILGPLGSPAGWPQFEKRQGRWHYRGSYPHAKLSVRGTGGQQVVLKDGHGKRFGVADWATALRELHPGAVYLHQGEAYLVRNLDLARGVAVLLPHLEDYYTQPRSTSEIAILRREETHHGVAVGRVRVSHAVIGYVRKRYGSEGVLDEQGLELPELAYSTQALWFSPAGAAGLTPGDLPAAMHALEHTLIGLLPAFVLCERADVGGVSYPLYPALGEPLVFIYDGYPGGVGYARAGAALFPRWLAAAQQLLSRCPCQTGCPRCILSPKCGNGNQVLDKAAARRLAEALSRILEPVSSGL